MEQDPVSKDTRSRLEEFFTNLSGKTGKITTSEYTPDKKIQGCLYDTRSREIKPIYRSVAEGSEQDISKGVDWGPYGGETTNFSRLISGNKHSLDLVRDELHPEKWQKQRQEHIIDRLGKIAVEEGLKGKFIGSGRFEGDQLNDEKKEYLANTISRKLESAGFSKEVLQSDALQQEVTSYKNYKDLKFEVQTGGTLTPKEQSTFDHLRETSLLVNLVKSVENNKEGLSAFCEKGTGRFRSGHTLNKHLSQHEGAIESLSSQVIGAIENPKIQEALTQRAEASSMKEPSLVRSSEISEDRGRSHGSEVEPKKEVEGKSKESDSQSKGPSRISFEDMLKEGGSKLKESGSISFEEIGSTSLSSLSAPSTPRSASEAQGIRK